MERFIRILALAVMIVSVVSLSGCSSGDSEDVAYADAVERMLENAEKMAEVTDEIKYLCNAYDGAMLMKQKWPESAVVNGFFKKHGVRIDAVPAEVQALALEHKQMESFMWAVERGEPLDLSYASLLHFWECGRDFRNRLVADYPEEVLPIFMDCAVKERDFRFFNKYAEAFRESGFRIVDPIEPTGFYSRYCRYVAGELAEAMEKKDVARIGFLLDHLPRLTDVKHIDPVTEDAMRSLAGYVCHELKDEALACKLVELKYDLGRIDLVKADFGSDFDEALKADPEHALLHVLDLENWHGFLTEAEARFLMNLSEEYWSLLHDRHVDEAVEVYIGLGESDRALWVIAFREGTRPMNRHGYHELLGWAIEHGDDKLFEFVRVNCKDLNIFHVSLVKLASNYELFAKYAPKLLGNVYETMDRIPRDDGITYGQIQDVLGSRHHKAALHILKHKHLQTIWPVVTEGRTLLMEVCRGGNLEAARYLVEEKGADVKAQTGYMKLEVSLFGRSDSKEGKLTPMFFAAASGNSELIRYLVSKGSFINNRSAYGATPLMYAVSNNRLDAVKTLLELRADVHAYMSPNVPRHELAKLGNYEEVATAYRRAVKNGNKEILQLLVNAGATP